MREISRLCGYLPLAIGMMARQLRHHPAWSAARRAAELAMAVDRLELMTTENLSVAAAFDLSYADLAQDQQRLFRRLGLHPGSEFDGYAAAALHSTGLTAARRGLEALYDQYLLIEPEPGRYRMHDLIREHARSLAGRLDPDDDRDRATGRLLDYYQHTTARANALVDRQVGTSSVTARQLGTSSVTAAEAASAAVLVLADQDQALAWLRAERASLLACLDYATGTSLHARVIALAVGLAALLRQDGPWAEAIARHSTALRSAQHLGDRHGQASELTNLGIVRQLTGDFTGAGRDLAEALGILRDLGDRHGQARALTDLGVVRRMTGEYSGAAPDLEEALGIYRDLGDRHGQARALTNLGVVRQVTGEYSGAARGLEEALGISRDLGDRHGQANALHHLGAVRYMTGNYPVAVRDWEEALVILRDLVTGRSGQRPRLPGERTADDRGLSRRGAGPGGGAGHLP